MSNKEEVEEMAQAFQGYTEIKGQLKTFLEQKPLYSKLKANLPRQFYNAEPDVLFLQCTVCGEERPFRDNRARGSGAGMSALDRNISGVYSFHYQCTGCTKGTFRCWVEANYEEGWIRKVGQLPMWVPTISKEIKEELGDDAELYQKALRNMAEGYGIGACSYFRRLVEKYINPLLQLLHDMKKEQGAEPEDLSAIQETIRAKDFTAKTRFAADIAPASLMVQGHNPLKEIHERLSVGLHNIDEETANQYAMVIRSGLEFTIKRLRREYEERKAYVEELKKIRKLPV